MSIRESVADALAGRTLQLVGAVFGVGALAHAALWAQASDRDVDAAVASEGVAAAAPAVATYAQSHPAYVLALLAGAVLLVRRP
ncbi:hypothetical protein [Halobacterium yunchengense]|uniref:hypothetical protein n=1 Tax=Halobacterium yunchengense TaxID=3108497 RepID=UPI00300B749E